MPTEFFLESVVSKIRGAAIFFSSFRLTPADKLYIKLSMSDDCPDLPCFCAAFRRVERILTRHYDSYLRECGLHPSQLGILFFVHGNDLLTQQELARQLSMDKATLSRNLQLLIRDGYLETSPGEDRRTRLMRLTAAGKKKVKQAIPLWEQAQQALEEKLGKDFEGILSQLNRLPGRLN